MLKESLISLAPLAFPASCFAAGCSCESVCNRFGAAGCISLAAVSAAVLFLALALVDQLRSLDAIRD